MQPVDKAPEINSLAAALEQCLQCPKGTGGPSIGDLCDAVAEKGFGLLLIILSLPSALPVPAPGYSTPFGLALVLLALQMLLGRQTLWLPSVLRRPRIPPTLAHKMSSAAGRFLHAVEKWIKPRHHWMRSRAGHTTLAMVILIMAALMILPIPLTNTFPALVIFLIGMGLAEEDGLLTLLAFAVGVLAVLLYIGVIYLLLSRGPEAVDLLKNWFVENT